MDLLEFCVRYQLDIEQKFLKGLHFQVFFVFRIAFENSSELMLLILTELMGFIELAYGLAGKHG